MESSGVRIQNPGGKKEEERIKRRKRRKFFGRGARNGVRSRSDPDMI
jgi:hypothetical protein